VHAKSDAEVVAVLAAWRRAIELSLGDADSAKLRSITHSRTEPASRVERARILLAYREDPSFFAVGRFGVDAKNSVLDVNCKAHELDNLYVVDTSFFVSIGAVNPSLTAIANAIRVGDHLLQRLG
jgi:choline dehydrogenase-like flavoprotein